jgi:hypothetical protein
MKHKKTIAILVTLFFISCITPTVQYNLLSNYKELKSDGKRLCIIFPKNTVSIPNVSDIETDSICTTPENIYEKMFEEDFPKAIQNVSNFSRVSFSKDYNGNEFNIENISLNKEQLAQILVPKNDSIFNDSIDIALIMSIILVERESKAEWNYYGAGKYGGYWKKEAGNNLNHWGYYSFWDNKDKQIIGYGEFNNILVIQYNKTNDNLRSLIKKSARDIINKTNFRRLIE